MSTYVVAPRARRDVVGVARVELVLVDEVKDVGDGRVGKHAVRGVKTAAIVDAAADAVKAHAALQRVLAFEAVAARRIVGKV